MCDKIEENRIIYIIEFLQKKLRYNDKLTNTLRIQLKKEDETFFHKMKIFIKHMYDKFEDYKG